MYGTICSIPVGVITSYPLEEENKCYYSIKSVLHDPNLVQRVNYNLALICKYLYYWFSFTCYHFFASETWYKPESPVGEKLFGFA